MANLIIKPSAGGQLIIKDEGDSAAITVATNGTTTFAEAATMSGNVTMSGTANNFGTVTAGTLGSAVTFPAGHILQVQYIGKRQSMGSSGSYVDLLNGDYLTITKSAGSNILIEWSSQFGKTGAAYLANSKIERATDTGFSANLTALRISASDATTDKPGGSVGFNNGVTYNYIGQFGHKTLDDSITSSAGTFYYRVQWKGSASIVNSGVDDGISTITAMEVKT